MCSWVGWLIAGVIALVEAVFYSFDLWQRQIESHNVRDWKFTYAKLMCFCYNIWKIGRQLNSKSSTNGILRPSENTNLSLYQVLFVHTIHGMPPSCAVNSHPLPSVALSPAEALSASSVLVSILKNILYQQSIMWSFLVPPFPLRFYRHGHVWMWMPVSVYVGPGNTHKVVFCP